MKPAFFILKLDETEYWCQEVKDKAKKIFGIYLFDKNKHVHCCELTPSYECTFVKSEWTDSDLSDEEQEELDSLIMHGNMETINTVSYFHTYVIDGLPIIEEQEVKRGITDLEVDNEEEALTYLGVQN